MNLWIFFELSKKKNPMSLGEEVEKISGNLVQNLNDTKVLEKQIYLLNRLKKQYIILPFKGITFSSSGDRCSIIYKRMKESLLELVQKPKSRRLETEEKVLAIFYKIVYGVAQIHNLRFNHRDLKLENYFIDRKNRVYLANFTSCRIYFPDTPQIYPTSSSLHYASPEIYDKTPHFGPEADVWALGVIFYLLLTKYFPFSGSIPSQVHQDIIEQCREKVWHPDPSLEIPPTSIFLLSQIFVYDATKRITVPELLSALEKYK